MAAGVEAGTRRRTRLPPEQRRAQLLAIALDVFAERGLGAARHAEIAERAGVAVSTVFVYFPTREDLVSAVLDEVERFFVGLSERTVAADKPVAEVLTDLGRAFLGALESERSKLLIWLEWGSAVREDVWPRYRAFSERIVALLCATLERGVRDGDIPPDVDVGSRARLFASSSQSLARLALGDVDRDTIDRFQRTALLVALGH